MDIRTIRDRSRGLLHEALKVPAVYVTPEGVWEDVSVRVHRTFQEMGGAPATYGGADRQEILPRIVFLASERVPVRGAVISVSEGEAYRIDHVLPRDGITITAEAAQMSAGEIAKAFPAGQPVP